MSNRINLSRAQADYLAKLKAEAGRAGDAFATALNAVALAVSDNGGIAYDFGAEPWIEVRPEGDARGESEPPPMFGQQEGA